MTDLDLKTLKDNLWHSADMLRAGAHLAAKGSLWPVGTRGRAGVAEPHSACVFKDVPEGISIDLFGQIYEYFPGNFALAEGQVEEAC